MNQPLAGVVLAGGKSTRLGQDKARIVFEGVDLLRRTVGLVSRFCPHVWVIGRDPSTHGVNVPWRMDEVPGLGPVGGVTTALKVVQEPCLVLSCDLPLLSEEVLKVLITGWAGRDKSSLMTTFRHTETGYIEPLVAVYQPEALETLRKGSEAGVRQISRVIPEEARHHIPCPRDLDMAFFNINYPADLKMLLELERMRKARHAKGTIPREQLSC